MRPTKSRQPTTIITINRSLKSLDDILDEKVQQDKHISIFYIGMELGIDHKTVLNHLHKSGYKKKLNVWVPHEFHQDNAQLHTSLITRQKLRVWKF